MTEQTVVRVPLYCLLRALRVSPVRSFRGNQASMPASWRRQQNGNFREIRPHYLGQRCIFIRSCPDDEIRNSQEGNFREGPPSRW
jgi:hypothetical protein